MSICCSLGSRVLVVGGCSSTRFPEVSGDMGVFASCSSLEASELILEFDVDVVGVDNPLGDVAKILQ